MLSKKVVKPYDQETCREANSNEGLAGDVTRFPYICLSEGNISWSLCIWGWQTISFSNVKYFRMSSPLRLVASNQVGLCDLKLSNPWFNIRMPTHPHPQVRQDNLGFWPDGQEWSESWCCSWRGAGERIFKRCKKSFNSINVDGHNPLERPMDTLLLPERGWEDWRTPWKRCCKWADGSQGAFFKDILYQW